MESINIGDQIDLAALKTAAASGNQLVHHLRNFANKPVGDGRGSRFTIGREHGKLLRTLVTAYEMQVGYRVPVSAVVRRAIEIAADHMTELLLLGDVHELRAETEAFRRSLEAVLNQD